MKRKINKVIFPLAIGCLLLTGCGKEVIREKQFEDKAIVKEVEYIPRKTRIMSTGKTTVPRTISAKYYITLDYNGIIINENNEKMYNICKDKLYEEVNCIFNKIDYDDGSSQIELIEVRDK